MINSYKGSSIALDLCASEPKANSYNYTLTNELLTNDFPFISSNEIVLIDIHNLIRTSE
jgi:5'(3')-deoxyribonucleotidase